MKTKNTRYLNYNLWRMRAVSTPDEKRKIRDMLAGDIRREMYNISRLHCGVTCRFPSHKALQNKE